jgi:poly-gamma-glutamate synthesis protein (capsule biosynthesis protein)
VSRLLGITGDLFLGSTTEESVFRAIAEQLGDDVRLMVNLEGTLFKDAADLHPARRKILLESPVHLLDALRVLPVELVCIGNNHVADYGNSVATFTREEVAQRYPVFGAGLSGERFHTALVDHEGVKLGFASYCGADTSPVYTRPDQIGPRPLDPERALSDLAELKQEADHCIAILHWGDEDYHCPRGDQVAIARQLIEAGFRLIIGNHSHTAQGFEKYRDGWIFYSLGNFYFPDHRLVIDGRQYSVRWMPRRSWGLLPLFLVDRDGITLQDVRIVHQGRNERPWISNALSHRLWLNAYSRLLGTPHFGQFSRAYRKVEDLVIRYEEFLNNEHKIRSLLFKLRKLTHLPV